MSIIERLSSLERPVRVGITGAGAMGRGLFYQCAITPGIECIAIADLHIERAIAAVEGNGMRPRIVNSAGSAMDAVRQGCVAVCEDGNIISRIAAVDVVIESTSAITEAAEYAIAALEHKKHLVLMNAEIDLIFGPYLMELAALHGVACASCDGDQHGVIKHLLDEIRLWGFELVMAGNIKGFLDRRATPATIVPEADKRKLDYKMCTAYTDGTKLNIEMAIVANALGLRTDRPGMHGPKAANVQEALELFDLEQIRASGAGAVDYILGAEPGGGVFAIGYCENHYQRDLMHYYKMGSGPYYLFYRPYHLCHVEAMRTVAEVALDSYSFLKPTHGFCTNVFAYAKRELVAGERLDGIGGHTCYGLIENYGTGHANGSLPICLADNVRIKRDIPLDGKIMLSDIDYVAARQDFLLYERALSSSGVIRQ